MSFEGRGTSGLAGWGYSRDRRQDLKQFILGLLTTQEGMPIGHGVLPGTWGHTVELDPERIRSDAVYDGKWVLATNVSGRHLPASEVARHYRGLWRVEHAFPLDGATGEGPCRHLRAGLHAAPVPGAPARAGRP